MARALTLVAVVLALQGYAGRGGVAQASSHAQTGRAGREELSSFSPDAIKKYVDADGRANLDPVWNHYGIKPEPFARYDERQVSYEAEVFPVAFDKDSPGGALLRVGYGDTYRYLIFEGQDASPGGPASWKYLGYVDVCFQQYSPPEHRVVSGEGQTWLVLKELWGRGTGVVRYGESWYEVGGDAGEMKSVLSYPVGGHEFPCLGYLGRNFESKVTRQGVSGGAYSVALQFSVSYVVSDCSGEGEEDKSLPLFSKVQSATYVRAPRAAEFVLDKSVSELSEQELEDVYNIDSLSDENFLEYNFRELVNLAREGSARQKEWLRRFLPDLPEGGRKKALGAALMR